MSGPTCETCQYFHPNLLGPKTLGECHDPSKIIYVRSGDRMNNEPTVGTNCECGNHTPKKPDS